jgi:phage terminase small subunit
MPKGKRTTTKRVQATENLPPRAPVPDVPVKAEVDEEGYEPKRLLTVRQRLFVEALIGPAGGNATKAAEMAGYKSDNRNALYVTACETLRIPKVQEAIRLAIARLKDSPEWARASLVDLASSSMENFVTVDDETGEMKLDPIKARDAAALGQIKKFRQRLIPGRDGAPNEMDVTIEIHDRTSALQTLLKLDGKLVDRMEHTGPDGGPVQHNFNFDDFTNNFNTFAGRPADARRNGGPLPSGNGH